MPNPDLIKMAKDKGELRGFYKEILHQFVKAPKRTDPKGDAEKKKARRDKTVKKFGKSFTIRDRSRK